MRKFLILTAFAVSITPALAYTEEENTFIDQLAEAYAISDICPTLGFEPKSLVFGLTVVFLDRADGEVIDEVVRRASDWSDLKSKRVDIVCLLGHLYYGEAGRKIKRLLVPK